MVKKQSDLDVVSSGVLLMGKVQQSTESLQVTTNIGLARRHACWGWMSVQLLQFTWGQQCS